MKSSTLMVRAIWTVVLLLALIGIGVVAERLARPEAGVGPPPSTDGTEAGYVQYPTLVKLHIIPGALFMILGPLQFVRRIRSRHLTIHRWSGRVFAATSLIIGITALIMGVIMPIGGAMETAATTVFALLFLFSIGRAVMLARHHHSSRHREWMLRAFAIGLAIATIRPIVVLFFALSDLSPREFFGIAFWLGFGIHLVAAEIWIHHTRRLAVKRLGLVGAV